MRHRDNFQLRSDAVRSPGPTPAAVAAAPLSIEKKRTVETSRGGNGMEAIELRLVPSPPSRRHFLRERLERKPLIPAVADHILQLPRPLIDCDLKIVVAMTAAAFDVNGLVGYEPVSTASGANDEQREERHARRHRERE